ncbi:MAG: hypothetical protein H6710_24830 [Myxococcales bacterium]|nr:hypothetical protein [Myxococcales bacterium]
MIYGKVDTEPVVVDGSEAGFSFAAAPPGLALGRFGGWAQIDGEGGHDRIVSTHEGDHDPPSASLIFVYFDDPPG